MASVQNLLRQGLGSQLSDDEFRQIIGRAALATPVAFPGLTETSAQAQQRLRPLDARQNLINTLLGQREAGPQRALQAAGIQQQQETEEFKRSPEGQRFLINQTIARNPDLSALAGTDPGLFGRVVKVIQKALTDAPGDGTDPGLGALSEAITRGGQVARTAGRAPEDPTGEDITAIVKELVRKTQSEGEGAFEQQFTGQPGEETFGALEQRFGPQAVGEFLGDRPGIGGLNVMPTGNPLNLPLTTEGIGGLIRQVLGGQKSISNAISPGRFFQPIEDPEIAKFRQLLRAQQGLPPQSQIGVPGG